MWTPFPFLLLSIEKKKIQNKSKDKETGRSGITSSQDKRENGNVGENPDGEGFDVGGSESAEALKT